MRRNSTTIQGISIVATFAALAVILATKWHGPPGVERSLHKAIGAALAQQALSLLESGGEIIVITRDTEAFPQPAMDVLRKGFQAEVRRARAGIGKVQEIQANPLRPVEVPSGDFFELLRRTPAGHVIVSFLGPPQLLPEQRARLGQIKPKVVAFCSGNMIRTLDLHGLFDAGILHAAVVSRPESLSPSGESQEMPRTFDQLYMTITKENLSVLSQDSKDSP